MVPGGITEVVWHFAGYLQIINDIARDRIDYDPAAYRSKQDDYVTPRPNYESNPDFDPLDSQGLKTPEPGLFDEFHNPRIFPIRSPNPLLPEADMDSDGPGGLPRLIAPRGAGGGGGGIEHKITVQYQEGGQQTELEIKQHNFLLDNDSLLVSPYGDSVACSCDTALITVQSTLIAEHSQTILERMADEANDQIPKEWWIPQNGTGITEFVTAHNEDQVSQDGAPGAHSVQPGYYLNGVLQEPAPPPPDQTPIPQPEPAPDLGNGLGQWATTGANDSWNASLIVDLSESGRSMIVMGDYFKTNAIFQTNSIVDHDHIDTAGGDRLSIAKGDNVTDNIADFVQHPGIYADLKATFAGPQWNVDVVEGNYYSVHTIVQMNYLLDNDIVVQKSADSHYELYSGGNEQGNLAQVFDGSIHYDLIIVAGAYHGMNVIFQNNLLLNNDYIKMFGEGTDPSQSVVSGQNELNNKATIENYGDDNFEAMNHNLESLVSAVGGGTTTLDPSYGKFVDGSGGEFNVLYVKGDYYDVNAVWQTNVVSDVNMVMQFLDPPSAAAVARDTDGLESQSVTSGKNLLSNDVAIIDVGATNTFVNGQVYGDTILVQANLLPDDKGHVLNHDAQALIPELIAFVNDSQEEAPVAQPVLSTPVHEDPIASVMH
ncbi:hypothetical protein [Afipia sp. DC4300-2b1]|uniref:hypothetical protein n=1 Tax=Afipia sp. DC4300-2b1 TaxID=2804672 RepID=UPI003CF984B9